MGRIRADKAHEKVLALGYAGSERSTRRAIAQVKAAWRLGHTRIHRPWITEPGMWLQYDFGDGPRIGGVKTILFVAWLAFSRFRIVIPLKDRTAPSVFAALDQCFRILGGAPTYVLTDTLPGLRLASALLQKFPSQAKHRNCFTGSLHGPFCSSRSHQDSHRHREDLGQHAEAPAMRDPIGADTPSPAPFQTGSETC